MDYQFILGGIYLATLLGFVLLFSSWGTKEDKRDGLSMDEIDRDSGVKSSENNGECQTDVIGDTDVIIVGAGVAGAALAHTLGQVQCLTLSHTLSPYI